MTSKIVCSELLALVTEGMFEKEAPIPKAAVKRIQIHVNTSYLLSYGLALMIPVAI
jgi:hypothetical protein